MPRKKAMTMATRAVLALVVFGFVTIATQTLSLARFFRDVHIENSPPNPNAANATSLRPTIQIIPALGTHAITSQTISAKDKGENQENNTTEQDGSFREQQKHLTTYEIDGELLKVKGPLLFNHSTGWNGTSHEEGVAFCKTHAGSRNICPWQAYCPRGLLFRDIQQHGDNEELLWSPVASESQPVWVAVGSNMTCMQRGSIDGFSETKVKYIMCCHKGEEDQAEEIIMPDVTTINQTDLSMDYSRCRNKCDLLNNDTEDSIIPSLHHQYCLGRCRWVHRQNVMSWLTDFSKAKEYVTDMTTLPPLLEGRCRDISDKLHYDGVCTSVTHRQKPRINLILSSKSWIGREVDLGSRDCAASQCYVSRGPGHSNSSHLYVGTIQKAAHPAQVKKANAHQINVMFQPESLNNTNHGKPMQPEVNIDWLASHRQDGFHSSSWIPYSQINADDNHFRIKGKGHGERRAAVPVFVTNCNPGSVHSDRARLIADLAKYVEIEQFGRCDLAGAKKGKLEEAYPMCANLPRRSAMWDAQKECVFFHSMFALVVENTFEENYVTEKLYQPLKMGTVPIIIGNSSLYRHHLPDPNAAIFLDDYADFHSAARYLQTLEKDSSLWAKHLAWKEHVFSDAFLSLASHSFATSTCDLCDKYAEEVLPNSERSWDRSLGLETVDQCMVDILSRHTIPDNLPLLNPSLGFDAVFVTHYTPLKERKEAMIERVQETLGVDPLFIEDFNRENLTNEDVACFGNSEAQKAYIQRVSGRGEVSLTLKHFSVYFYMVQQSLDNVLILEDDAAFAYSDWTSKNSVWQKILTDLPADYDIVFLSNYGRPRRGVKVTENLYLAQQSRVASAYLISQKGARNMLRSLPMVAIIDYQMNCKSCLNGICGARTLYSAMNRLIYFFLHTNLIDAASWKGNKWIASLPPGFHGPQTVDIKLFHSEPALSYQTEPDGTHHKTATWRVE
ncbi:hypothetical protein ACHAXR_009057 [Thalassiosira sp. AJA248-18]